MRIVTFNEFIDEPDEELTWVVHGLIPKPSMILLAGEPKAGKSYLAVDIANRIAEGRDVLGHASEKTRVLYLMTDARAPVWRIPLRKIRTSGVVFSPDIVAPHSKEWHRPANILASDSRAWFKEVLRDANPGLVVLDVLRDVHNGDENDSTAMKIVMDAIESVFRDVALLLVHHTKKIADDIVKPRPQLYSRGSSYLMGKVDSLWILHKNYLGIDARFGDKVEWLTGSRDEESGLWSFEEVQDSGSKTAQCLALCDEFPFLSHTRIAQTAKERFGMSRSTYYRLMSGRACVHYPKKNLTVVKVVWYAVCDEDDCMVEVTDETDLSMVRTAVQAEIPDTDDLFGGVCSTFVESS